MLLSQERVGVDNSLLVINSDVEVLAEFARVGICCLGGAGVGFIPNKHIRKRCFFLSGIAGFFHAT
jgi:hypothetical protein